MPAGSPRVLPDWEIPYRRPGDTVAGRFKRLFQLPFGVNSPARTHSPVVADEAAK
jgi:hypothetical protein